MIFEARIQGHDWRRVSANYVRGYCLTREEFAYALAQIDESGIVTIKGQDFRKQPEHSNGSRHVD